MIATDGDDVELEEPDPDDVLRKLDEKFAARIQALRDSTRLSGEDFNMRINV